ncbi:MAG: LD-carboxypeptidase [Acetobacteraceae bacterium]|nr:LD-carboxypeptidase [Acetobacteraceae bacterium]
MPIKPPALKAGDVIGVVCPAQPVMFPPLLEEGVRCLEGLGFRVRAGPSVTRPFSYLAGTDRERAEEINVMFGDPEVRAIFCTSAGPWGGRLAPLLDYELIRRSPKVFMGMNGPTALLNAIHARTGLITFHGPAVEWDFSWHLSPYTKEYLFRALLSRRPVGRVTSRSPRPCLVPGRARGRLLGGCLRALASLIGTPYEPDWEGAILFWEAAGCDVYQIDDHLTHLKLAGVFDRIAGMVVGRTVGWPERSHPAGPDLATIILELCGECGFPILAEVDVGVAKDKATLPVGAMARMDAARGELVVEESGVA